MQFAVVGKVFRLKSRLQPPSRMPEKPTEKVVNDLAARAFKLVAPFLIGALVTSWMTASGDHAQTVNNQAEIVKLQTEVKELRDTYATNRRVDDVVSEMRATTTSINTKLDRVVGLLLEKR